MRIRVKFWTEMTDRQKFLKLVYYVQLSKENRKRLEENRKRQAV